MWPWLLALASLGAGPCEGPGSPAPELLASWPVSGTVGVPATEWLRLRFAAPLEPGGDPGFELRCGGAVLAFQLRMLEPDLLLVNPEAPLPDAAACTLAWRGPAGPVSLAFFTAPPAPPPTVRYDRRDRRLTNPFPDDFWLVPDVRRRSGWRLDLRVEGLDAAERQLLGALLAEANRLDGFSPLGPFVVELSHPPDPHSFPLTRQASLDPLATVRLFALPDGRRVPFRLELRSDASPAGPVSHILLLFPSVPLEPETSYGLVVTRRARAADGRPYAPSPFLQRALGPGRAGDPEPVARVRGLAREVLDGTWAADDPPLSPDDLALALRATVRSTADLPADLLAIREQIRALDPPEVEVRSVEADDHPDVAAVVRGVWSAPEFRRGAFFARDPVSGRPLLQELRPLEFVLALPASAAAGAPAPVVFYQHGNPGTPEEAVDQARRYLGAAGFAVVGFQDVLSRELGGGARDPATAFALQVSAIVSELLRHGRLVDAWAQTNAEQLAFLRAIEGLKDLDLLPLGAPDGVSDLDLAAPRLYEGVSQGANHAPAFLAYAPEIRAAALVAGGSRLTEQLIHQASSFLLTTFGALLPGLTPADLWFGMALFQAVHDRQDAHNHARFLHREPVELDGSTRRASVLLIGGLEDSLVPNHATESLAWALGPLPHLEPGAREVPILRRVAGPVQANLGADATGAFVHYAPPFVPGVPASPGCRSGSADGHFCAQSAAESRRQRLRFFESALDPLAAPTITSPYEE